MDLQNNSTNEYACLHCKGKAWITALEDSAKGTEPLVEFCPFCGMPFACVEDVDRTV